MLSRMKGSRVLITGASSGIGKAVAFEFARRGAKLTLASRRLDALKNLVKEIQSAYPDTPQPMTAQCDVTRRKDVKRMVKETARRFGGIDVLVNNAGTGVYGNVELTTLEDFRAVMEVNFFGAVQCMMEALPFLKQAEKGLVINIASVAAKHGVPYLGAYGASKAALAVVSQSFRTELKESGVSLMVVYPSYTQTDFFKNEKKVGGARRFHGPYASPLNVARAIVRAAESGKKNLVLSLEGKALTISQSVFPRLVEKVMDRIAYKLREKQEASNA
ncbi:MAG: SDR family oxidoreductase [Candidatus Aminicenantes bacterium]